MTDSATTAALERVTANYFAASALLDSLRLFIWDSEGLTVTQLRLLGFVNEEPGIGNAELADRLLVTRPSVSALLDRLERGGYVRREVSPSDRRGICIRLEERGQNAISNLRGQGPAYVAQLLACLAEPELNTIADALDLLVQSGRESRRRALAADAAE